MKLTERVHTLEDYQKAGMDPLLEHIEKYFRGEGTVPVIRANVIDTNPQVEFTYSDSLMQSLMEGKLDKPHEVAIKYGFRGFSTGGRNGIFLQRKPDAGLITATETLVESQRDRIIDDLVTEDFDSLRGVKIVWHNESGTRVVGVYNESNQRIAFLDFAQY